MLYKSYLAGNREPRFASEIVYDKKLGWLWDATIGARVRPGALRHGGLDPSVRKAGSCRKAGNWTWKAPRFPASTSPPATCRTCDYRAGMPITYRQGPWEVKFGYYHYCSHLGDLYIFENPGVTRIDYDRDCADFRGGGLSRPERADLLGSRLGVSHRGRRAAWDIRHERK